MLLQQSFAALYKTRCSQVMDDSIGANRKAISNATNRIDTIPAGKQRFQSGSVDEVSFLGECLPRK